MHHSRCLCAGTDQRCIHLAWCKAARDVAPGAVQHEGAGRGPHLHVARTWRMCVSLPFWWLATTATCSMKPLRYALRGQYGAAANGQQLRQPSSVRSRTEGARSACSAADTAGTAAPARAAGRATCRAAAGPGSWLGASLWLFVRRQPDHHPALGLMKVHRSDLRHGAAHVGAVAGGRLDAAFFAEGCWE